MDIIDERIERESAQFSDFINTSAWLLLMIVLKKNPRSLF